MEQKEIRFIDSKYNELFIIPDGSYITLTYPNGDISIKPCNYIDDYHTVIDNKMFHIGGWCEQMQRNNIKYAPTTEADRIRLSNEDIIKENFNELEKDKFFMTDNGFTEVYYNPDADAGGQLVYNDISFDLIKADYLSSLKYAKENSFLEDLDELNIDVEFQNTAENSVAFMVLERLGYNAFEFFENEDFPHIVDFNTPQTMHLLGGIVSSIAEQTLREVAETIRAEAKKERTAPKFFAENEKIDYNIDREENSQIINTERTEENGRTDLQTGRRLSDTEHRTSREQADRQIRDAERNILEEGTELPVQHDADGRDIERTSLGDRPNSEATGRTDGAENGTGGEHQRGAESKRPVEVDRTDEQPFTFRRRSDTPSANLQLSLFPLLEEQQDIIREAEQATFGSAFSISQQIIDEVIASGSNRESTAINICIEYSKNKSLDDKIAFLRKEFDVGGKGFVFDDKNISVWWNYDGMYISQGNTATTYDEHLSWEQVSNRIDELLELGRFASPEVISSFTDIEKDRVAKYMFEVIRNINGDDYPVLKDIFKGEIYQGSYDDAVSKIKASLENPQDIQHHISLLNILETAKNNHDEVMRFRFYQPDVCISQMQDMLLPRKVFASELETASMPQRFITEDEINKILCRGSNKADGKYRIYDFFTKNTDKKARRDFLDKEFGWGSSHGFPYEINHDKKGLVLSRRDILSPFAKVTMKFSEMEKRIDDLINKNAYLTENEKTVGYPAWAEKEKQLQAAIQLRREQDEYLMSFSRDKENVNLSNFPKRLHTLVQYCKGNYEGRLFAENGFENLFEMTELDIPVLLLNDDTRDKLQKCLKTVGGRTSDVTIRNSSYIMSDELLQYRKIDLHRLGDFYEAYSEDAKLVAEVLELTLTGRNIDGERVDMVGFPQHTLEKYAGKLQDNNIIVNYADGETPIVSKPVEAVKETETAPEVIPELDSKIQDVHNDFKAKNPDYIILIINDENHYEVYGEDAKTTANILGTSLEQRTVAGFTETAIDMTPLLPPNQTEEFIDRLKAAGQNVILVAKLANIRKSEGDKLVKVVYICSNIAIADQNLNKLRISSEVRKENAGYSRLSMQHLNIFNQENDTELLNSYIQLIPLTPDTSFRMTTGAGTVSERALMFAILKRVPELQDYLKQIEVIMKNDAYSAWEGERNWYENEVISCDIKSKNKYIDFMLKKTKSLLKKKQDNGNTVLKALIEQCETIKANGNKRIPCNELIGKLRIIFAQISLDKLEPDLVIMDEFQRFKYLINSDPNSETGMLANKFFNSDKVRMLLLSATPYKMYSTLEEIDETQVDEHYSEFLDVMDFLNITEQEKADFKTVWSDYSVKLKEITKGETTVIEAKNAAENAMYQHICRTERISASENADIIDDSDVKMPLKVLEQDIKSYMQAQKLLDDIAAPFNVPVDYIKSTPYIMSFMRDYQLKRYIEKYFSKYEKALATLEEIKEAI